VQVRNVDNLKLDHVRTMAGKGRAFLRMALVEKNLDNYFRSAASNKEAVARFYQPHALMRQDEIEMVIPPTTRNNNSLY
jgi:hypothetical protein